MCLSYSPPKCVTYYEKSLYEEVQPGIFQTPVDQRASYEKICSPGVWFQPEIDTIHLGSLDQAALWVDMT
jgi:hypothetical protein